MKVGAVVAPPPAARGAEPGVRARMERARPDARAIHANELRLTRADLDAVIARPCAIE
jgi:hypothetical protein